MDAIQGKSEKRNKPYCNYTVLSTAAFDAEVRQTRKSFNHKRRWKYEMVCNAM
ncbi:MAG: hypothetical protein HYW78_04395 [Parcubacteria group bacterium]|nr:hypothetical protein [Parcubacteria group bacterium]